MGHTGLDRAGVRGLSQIHGAFADQRRCESAEDKSASGSAVTPPTMWHLVRLRRSDDLPFLRPGMLDELMINANQLENSPESTAAHLRKTGLRYMVDPVLWRFQEPQ